MYHLDRSQKFLVKVDDSTAIAKCSWSSNWPVVWQNSGKTLEGVSQNFSKTLVSRLRISECYQTAYHPLQSHSTI